MTESPCLLAHIILSVEDGGGGGLEADCGPVPPDDGDPRPPVPGECDLCDQARANNDICTETQRSEAYLIMTHFCNMHNSVNSKLDLVNWELELVQLVLVLNIIADGQSIHFSLFLTGSGSSQWSDQESRSPGPFI